MTTHLDPLTVEHGEIPLGVVARPVGELDLASWMATHRAELDRTLLAHGAILFRDVPMTVDAFGRIAHAHGLPQAYQLGTAPRASVAQDVFESTRFDPRLKLPLHNEQSYLQTWPRKVWFYCQLAALHGGATPLAETRKVTRRIPSAIKDLFRARGVRYHRVYENGAVDAAIVQPVSAEGQLPVAWQTAFGTTDRSEVACLCAALGVEFHWQRSGRLQTSNAISAFAHHPDTGEEFWFNQLHNLSFHAWGIDVFGPEAAREPVTDDALARLPRHVTFGDGSAIEPSLIAELGDIYRSEETTFEWRTGDLLVLDNVLIAHGREPYRGPRRVLAALTGATRSDAP
ncbi:MAG TPA: TauD/TfdA family dioxygenase [Kofleriaceae bacterium]|nr:TauD/TfdA family dioxygenase [Kofleriaceae bacterium]